ncbi:hypothetical protein [Halospina sp. K52047b]|uniref:hypothetical protein n=1 Tax=Halospina sp. K52047b TaxID=2614160 RepID=UPI00124A70B7|nr:hypothetical protein [Halospina sp. K52047b]KAA8985523.1 hypothetical protein F3089_02340 [Halospina sp. K52047b]
MELDVTWQRVVKVWWAYLWRSLLAMVAAMILGAIVGFVMGLVLGAAGVGPDTIQLITAPIGGVIGLLISIIPMKLILGKDFGEFRLVLTSNETRPESP